MPVKATGLNSNRRKLFRSLLSVCSLSPIGGAPGSRTRILSGCNRQVLSDTPSAMEDADVVCKMRATLFVCIMDNKRYLNIYEKSPMSAHVRSLDSFGFFRLRGFYRPLPGLFSFLSVVCFRHSSILFFEAVTDPPLHFLSFLRFRYICASPYARPSDVI